MSSVQRVILMLLLTLMWSPSFLFIKLAVQDLPPLMIATLRISIAASILLVILYSRGGRLPTSPRFWFHSVVTVFFAAMAPFYLFSFAEQTIESALAAILNGTSPMFTALLAQFFMPSDRLTPQKAFGIALSAGGLLLLFAPNIFQGMESTTTGICAGALAAFSYAMGHIYAKKFASTEKPFVAPTAQFLAASLILIPIALWVETPWILPFPSVSAIGGVLGLACLGTVCAFVIYYRLLEHCGPTAISTVACFFPLGGMLLGVIFLDETFTVWGGVASGMILTGLLAVNEMLPMAPLQFLFRSRERARET